MAGRVMIIPVMRSLDFFRRVGCQRRLDGARIETSDALRLFVVLAPRSRGAFFGEDGIR